MVRFIGIHRKFFAVDVDDSAKDDAEDDAEKNARQCALPSTSRPLTTNRVFGSIVVLTRTINQCVRTTIQERIFLLLLLQRKRRSQFGAMSTTEGFSADVILPN